jgi:hypothetical protein
MSYQLLCVDVDGTLLNSRGEITGGNREAVAAAVKAGKKVALCSGRTWKSLQLYEGPLGLNVPGQFGIGFNGGAVYEILNATERRLLFNKLMPEAIAQEIFAALAPVIAQYNEMHMLAYNNEGYLIAEDSLQSSRLFDEMVRLGARTVPAYKDLPGDMYKILIHGKHEDLLEITEIASTRFAGKCQPMFSAHSLLELIPMDVDKGLGVAFLAGHLGIPIGEVIAMGDEANDTAMLRRAGLGIAVANAVPDAAAAADIQIPVSNNQDAVAFVINEYLLRA